MRKNRSNSVGGNGTRVKAIDKHPSSSWRATRKPFSLITALLIVLIQCGQPPEPAAISTATARLAANQTIQISPTVTPAHTIFLPTIQSTLALPNSDYQFTIDANTIVQGFEKEMLGVAHGNWDHSWGKYFPGEVPKLAEIYQAAHVGLIRYAGGLWANFVMWERTPQKTPYGTYYPNPANFHPDFAAKINTGNEYNFQYGTDEIDSLAKLAKSSGAGVLIQVNMSKNDPYMWADMVHYVNIEKNYGFQYWELGNEIDLECYQGNANACITADEYKTRAENYIRVMKAVDPTITIVAGAPSAGHDIVANNWADTPKLSRYLVAGEEAGADALSFHWYTDCNLKTLDNVLAWKYDEPDTAWQHMYSRYWSYLGPTRVQEEIIDPSGRSMEIGVTEMNIDACDVGRAPVNSNHIAALWYADVIGRLAYNGTDFVSWYEGYGNGSQGFPAVFIENEYYPTEDTIYLRPLYYAIFLYGNYFGDTLVETDGPASEPVSIYASLDQEDPNKLFIIVTNLSADFADTAITMTGFSASKGFKYALTNPNPLSLEDKSNGRDHGSTINGYQLTASHIATAADEIPAVPVRLENGYIFETFSPYSITALVLEK